MSTVERRLGKYVLQELLGRGGMAEVWKAVDTQLQCSVHKSTGMFSYWLASM